MSLNTRMLENVVPAEGPLDAKIVIVGEGPGKVEFEQCKPFVGPSGRTLNMLLSRAGIKRHECYITNVIKSTITNTKKYYHDSRQQRPTQELYTLRKQVHTEIKNVNPNLILACGNEALKCVLDREDVSISDWRGSVIETSLGKVIPIYHPAMLLRQWNWTAITEMDLRVAAKEMEYPEIRRMERTLMTTPQLFEVEAFIKKCEESEYLAFDIETSGANPKRFIDCIAFAIAPDYAMSIPITDGNGEPYWSLEDEAYIWKLLVKVLTNPKIKKIGQNAQYDIIYLNRAGVPVRNLWLDTMNMSNVIYPELPKALDFLASIYTDIPYYKDTIRSDRWVYNALDAAATYEVAFGQLKDAEELDVKDFYFNHVHPILQIYIEIHEQGVLIDKERIGKAKKTIEEELKDLQLKLNELVGHELNVNSTKQMQTYLYETLKFPVKYSKQGRPTANHATIEEFYRKTGREELALIIEIRQKRKILSTYLNAATDADGRMRCSYNVSGTETGRLSSSQSLDGTGTNLQNVPKGLCRSVFVADPGFKFVGGDLAQAENRVVAYLCGDIKMLQIAEEEDMHTLNAANIFDKIPEKVTPEERQIGKRITHGSNYRMGPITFAQFAKLPTAEAKRQLQRYHDAYPRLRMWHKQLEKKIQIDRTLVNPFGRKRVFMGRIDDSLFRDATAYLPQSTVADILHRATYQIYSRLPWPAVIAMQLHDSLTVMCPEEMTDDIVQIMREELERPVEINGNAVRIPADIKVGDNWSEIG